MTDRSTSATARMPGSRSTTRWATSKRALDVPWTPVTSPKDGKITQSGGSAVALDFSHDPAQQFIYLINQNNAQVEIIDRQPVIDECDWGDGAFVRGAIALRAAL